VQEPATKSARPGSPFTGYKSALATSTLSYWDLERRQGLERRQAFNYGSSLSYLYAFLLGPRAAPGFYRQMGTQRHFFAGAVFSLYILQLEPSLRPSRNALASGPWQRIVIARQADFSKRGNSDGTSS
jgi:hypothetical protein